MEKIKTITKEELRQKMREGNSFQVVNVLEPSSYHLGFIEGSRRIPGSMLPTRYTELDKTREVITYCADKNCNASTKAAELLQKEGFKVRAYKGGIEEWKAAGYPIETFSLAA